MTVAADSNFTFNYEAQTQQGRPMAGTIVAADLDAAMQQLLTMGLRVTTIEPIDRPIRRAKALRGDDFLSFNEQLAHLAKAGMPVEHGLRLMAQDLKRGRLAATVRAVADELEKGVSLEQAIEKYQDKFPPLYSKLIAAGSRNGDLASTLFSTGQHVEMVQRLRRSVWRASAYPLMIAVSLGIVLLLLSIFVFPEFDQAYRGFGFGKEREVNRWARWRNPSLPTRELVELPIFTQIMFALSHVVPWVVGVLLAVLIVWPIVGWVMRKTGTYPAFEDAVLLRIPVVGPALKLNLLARWCDVVRLAAVAGMDLPSAVALAGDAVASPRLRSDSAAIIHAMESGHSLDAIEQTKLLPRVVPSMLELASRSGDLPAALDTLSSLYQRQAEVRIRAIPLILTPALMIVIGAVIACVIAGLLAPLLQMFRWLIW